MFVGVGVGGVFVALSLSLSLSPPCVKVHACMLGGCLPPLGSLWLSAIRTEGTEGVRLRSRFPSCSGPLVSYLVSRGSLLGWHLCCFLLVSGFVRAFFPPEGHDLIQFGSGDRWIVSSHA